MANFDPYKPTLNTKDYLTRIPAFIDVVEDYATEVETARDGEASLAGKITVVETMFNDYSTTTEMQAYVQGQIISGGVDWSTIGTAGQYVVINGTGDGVVGLTPPPPNYAKEWWLSRGR